MCAVLWMICYFDRLHCKDLKVLIKSKIWIPTTIEIICFNNTCTQGISQQTLQSLIDFIYTGRVALCQENVQVFISIPIYSVIWLGKLPGFHFSQRVVHIFSKRLKILDRFDKLFANNFDILTSMHLCTPD